ncbi:hypothetical protein GCM10010129_01870 [Streptomyces fumigatiscleroticus]|nr:hypothetical protein GCM10010129_01870 [Streptomyces fumigatiscleroticus]
MRRRLLSAAALAAALTGITTPHAVAADRVGELDETLLTQTHQGNLTEITAGHDAQRHATSDCVRKAGAVLVRDHTKLDADGSTLAGRLGVTLPASPSAQQQKDLAAVRAKAGGAAYDAAWLTTQEKAHRETLALLDREIRGGSNAEVRAAARTARPVVAMHLDMVRGGTCHTAEDAGTVGAGTGGRLAAAESPLATAGTVSMAGGGLLTAAGAVWLLRARRRPATKR